MVWPLRRKLFSLKDPNQTLKHLNKVEKNGKVALLYSRLGK